MAISKLTSIVIRAIKEERMKEIDTEEEKEEDDENEDKEAE